MSNYFNRKKLEKNIISLSNKKVALRKELKDICKELDECYKKQIEMKQIESVKIKFGDLLDELKQIAESDISMVYLEPCAIMFSKDLPLDGLDYRMQFFGGKLEINFESGEDSLIYSGLVMFDSVNDIQADEKTLLEHCSLIPWMPGDDTTCNIIADKNIEELVCRFTLDNVLSAATIDDDSLLEQAVYNLIDKNKVLDTEYTKEKEQGKQKTLTR